MALKHTLFGIAEKPFSAFFRSANRLNTRLLQSADPVYSLSSKYGSFSLACSNNITFWRAHSFFTKEPDTLEWIDSFAEGDVLFDVGANVGLYSVYAGLKGHRVFAFEPEASNFAILNKNIFLNQLQDRVTAFNFAISETTGFERLQVSEMRTGSALHSLNADSGFDGHAFSPVHSQGVQSYSLDDLSTREEFGIPHHIKIDVDGLEPAIIAGSSTLLQNPQVKSILIELNTEVDTDLELKKTIEAHGFECTRQFRADIFIGSDYENVYNFTFHRRIDANV